MLPGPAAGPYPPNLWAIAVADAVDPGYAERVELRRYGYLIFKWLLGLLAFEFILLLIYGVYTFPRFGEVVELAPPAERQIAWESARDNWVTSIKDLGQIFLLTPIFPLIGAVIGYIFGRQQDGGTQP
jgi:hypothetical protein